MINYLTPLLICINLVSVCAHMCESFCLQPCNVTLEEESSAHQPDFSEVSVQAERELQLQA